MTRRLLLSYLGLALLILVVLEIPLGVIAARHERSTAVAQATRDADGLAVESAADLQSGDPGGLQRLLDDYHARTGAQVFVIRAGDRVVVQVDPDHDDDAGRADRKLVLAALRGQSVSVLGSASGRPTAEAAVPVGSGAAPLGAVLLLSPVGAFTDRAEDIWLALALFGVGVMVLTAGVGLWLARSLSRPLAQLQGAVTTLGEGQLTSRAPVDRGPPEMRALAEHFNRMADRMEELISAQTRFVADASHQLRSPLTALRLRLENLEADVDPEAGEPLAAAGREVQRLSRLVDGLLTISRADGPRPDLVPVDLRALVADRCDAWAALAVERRVHLVRGGDAGRPVVVPLVPGDVEQILDNLLANAVDASPPDSTITVTVTEPHRDRVTLHVADQGPGLAAEERRRAFDRFWQGPRRRGGHSGLGLAIVRQLALRNGLDVELLPVAAGGLDAAIHVRITHERPAEPEGAVAAIRRQV